MSKTRIRCRARGPLVVEGDFELFGLDGERIDTLQRVQLCRCGASRTRPICDGSHYRTDFEQAVAESREEAPKANTD